MWHHQWMNGIASDRFGTEEIAERAQIVTILWRMEGSPVVNYIMPFTDVDQDAWYAEAVRWAASQKIVNGHGDGTFCPEDPVTRAAFAAMLYRYVQHKGGGFVGMWMFPLRYDDAAYIPEWAYEPFCWLTMHGIYRGASETTLAPNDTVSRGEAAEMLYRLTEVLAEE